jgi:hypothetical protein
MRSAVVQRGQSAVVASHSKTPPPSAAIEQYWLACDAGHRDCRFRQIPSSPM